MDTENKYFICERKNGCRLTDLNFTLIEGQKFERDIMVVEGSKSIKAALRVGWIREMTEEEFLNVGEKK